MSIVCGTDFSTPAMLAADVGARLALRAGVPLWLVHAVNDLGAEASFAAGQSGLYDEPARRLDAEARRIALHGVEVRPVFRPGLPEQVLAAVAAEEAAQLIVVASVGVRSPDAWLLGSVPERLAITAPAPILVVRGRGGWESWLEGTRCLRVVAGIDGGESGRAVARILPGLRNLGACDVTAVRVAWPAGERLRLGLRREGDPASLPELARDVLERELRAEIGALPGDGALQVVIESARSGVDTHLVHTAEALGADVLVVGSHRRTGLSRLWHGSVSRAVLHHAPMSVLIVPGSAEGTGARTGHRWQALLATTDGSPLADRAIGEAYAALGTASVVHLLTVLDVDEAGAEAVARAREHLGGLVPADASGRGIHTEFHVIEDHATARAIVAAAERLGVDAICMGTHGRSGISAALTGSIAREVLGTSLRPLILVRSPGN